MWRAHVAAGLLRKDPSAVKKCIDVMAGMKPRDGDTRHTLCLSSELAMVLHADFFQTLYHAVAIEKGIELVTADADYHQRAAHLGHIRMLRDWVTDRASPSATGTTCEDTRRGQRTGRKNTDVRHPSAIS